MSYGDQVWEELFKSSSWGSYPSEEAIRFYMRAKRNFKSPSVLDIGAGQGAVSWFMTKEGGRVTAIEGSPTGLERLANLTQSFGYKISNAINGDIMAPTTFLASKFDIMVDHYSMYSNPEEKVRQAYNQYFDLLNPGGQFLTCCFGANCTGVKTGKNKGGNTWFDIQEGPLKDRGVSTIWTKKLLSEVLIQSGFEIQYSETITQKMSGIVQEKIIIAASKPV